MFSIEDMIWDSSEEAGISHRSDARSGPRNLAMVRTRRDGSWEISKQHLFERFFVARNTLLLYQRRL